MHQLSQTQGSRDPVQDYVRRAGCHPELGLHLTRIFREGGLPWPTIKAGHLSAANPVTFFTCGSQKRCEAYSRG